MTTPSGERPLADETTLSSSSAAAGAGRTPPRAAGSRSTPHTPVLAEHYVVAGRYRIVRFVAHGGMGEVYEAEDRELHERVALKRLMPEIAGSRRAIDRFKREIQLARRVTHPNVCRIFDIGFDDAGAGAKPGTEPSTFLTMELLEGETLSARIKREGALGAEVALPIAEQIASALTALHGAGIIHRDFKSQNVLLVGDRAVVTDFGLARVSSGEQLADMASCTGAMLGSPATMAPEQVEGKKVTAAADIYALGVVLFEMVTGRLPFSGPTPLATAFKRLQEDPPSPRSLASDLDPRWDAAILRCLQRAPENRFSTAQAVACALAGTPHPDDSTLAARPRGTTRDHRSRWILGAALVALLGSGGVALYRRGAEGPGAGGRGGEEAARRRSVAVLGFKNLSGRSETAWLSTAFSEMLRTELSAAERVRLVPGESVARMKSDLSLADADSFASDTLERIQKNLDADYVVVGSYTALGKESGGKIRFDVRVQQTHSGELLASVSESGTEAELLELVARTGRRLRDSLHAEPLPGAVDRAQASLPENTEGARLYSEGLAKLRSFDGMGAKDLLERAIVADPTCPMPHSALSQALRDLGYEQRATEEAKKAFELAGDLPREDRLLVEGRYHEAAHEWVKAIATYRTLLDSFPDNVEYGLRLAGVQAYAGRYTDASATVAALRKLPSASADDPRLDLAEAWGTPDYRVQGAAAARAAEKGRARGSRLLVAEAEMSLAWSHLYQGEPDLALEALERGRRIYAEMGNEMGAIWALGGYARALAAKGQISAAIVKNEEAARQAVQSGSKGSAAKSLFSAAFEYAEKGDLANARARRDDALRYTTEAHDGTCEDCHLVLDGWFAFIEGDLDAAAKSYEAARAKRGGDENIDDTDMMLGGVLLARGDLEGARARYQAALTAFEQKGVAMLTPIARIGIGASWLEQGKPGPAEPAFRDALAAAQKQGSPCVEAMAWAGIARTLRAKHSDEAARAAVQNAVAILPKMENLMARVVVASAALRVRGAPADRELASAVLADATRARALGMTFELRLALAVQALGTPGRAEALKQLAAVERDAEQKGYALIARKAAAARRPAAPPDKDHDPDGDDDGDDPERGTR